MENVKYDFIIKIITQFIINIYLNFSITIIYWDCKDDVWFLRHDDWLKKFQLHKFKASYIINLLTRIGYFALLLNM